MSKTNAESNAWPELWANADEMLTERVRLEGDFDAASIAKLWFIFADTQCAMYGAPLVPLGSLKPGKRIKVAGNRREKCRQVLAETITVLRKSPAVDSSLVTDLQILLDSLVRPTSLWVSLEH